MTLTRQQTVAYGTVGILLIVLIIVAVTLQVFRGRERVTVPERDVVSIEGLPPSAAAQPFNTAVLKSLPYQAFDRSLLDQGRVPVPPPAARGKPNLF